jgi:hypothetical protein
MHVEYQRSIETYLQWIGLPSLWKLWEDHYQRLSVAPGSSHNHQAWIGGYLDHVLETMNIAYWLYVSCPRKFSFPLNDALVVLFLHDIEKPWKADMKFKDKEARRKFRDEMITLYQIILTDEQKNALRYVEGEGDDYSPKGRIMNEMAGFCHACDVLSARTWHDKGQERKW